MFSLKLKELREKKGLSQYGLAAELGCPQSTIGNWEAGKRETNFAMLQKIANYFEVSIDYLIGDDDLNERLFKNATLIPMENMIPMEDLELFQIPLLGEVVAGVPIEAQQNLEGYIYISRRPAEDYFALRVHGDSMKNVGIVDKSIIVCHKQETAESGEIVVAMLNGEQTVKRLKVHGANIYLMPENPDFLPIPVTPTDDLVILGKVVELRVDL